MRPPLPTGIRTLFLAGFGCHAPPGTHRIRFGVPGVEYCVRRLYKAKGWIGLCAIQRADALVIDQDPRNLGRSWRGWSSSVKQMCAIVVELWCSMVPSSPDRLQREPGRLPFQRMYMEIDLRLHPAADVGLPAICDFRENRGKTPDARDAVVVAVVIVKRLPHFCSDKQG